MVSPPPVVATALGRPLGVCLSSGTSCAGRSPGGEALEVLNLKGGWAGGFTQGRPGPLAFTPWSDTACAMALLPSCNVVGLAVR